MRIKDKETYEIYEAYAITHTATISLELNQTLSVGPSDILIESINGYMLMSKENFDKKFELIIDER